VEAGSIGGVIGLCIAMFLSTTFFGWIPKFCGMSFKTKGIMKFVNLYGNGLAIGAALLIIIPEGVNTLTAAFLDKAVAS
jgi:hypothetical protein